jgi:exodeoxyribonuclease V alpha subunit
MTKLQIFYEIWHKQGRVDALLNVNHLSQNFAEVASRQLFYSGFISDYDLRLCRMLYDRAHTPGSGDNPDQGGLLLFLVMMAASLNQGNVYLKLHPDELAAEYTKIILQALAMRVQDQGDECTTIDKSDIDKECRRLAGEFGASYDKGMYSAIIGVSHKPIVRDATGWFFQKYYTAHTTVGSMLVNRLENSMGASVDDGLVRQALAAMPAVTHLHQLQKIALGLSCLNGTVVITGGPGTGKTTVVAQTLRLLLLLEPHLVPQEDFVICAPTGRAAARLQESIARDVAKNETDPLFREGLLALKGRTVHGVLGYDPHTGRFRRGPRNQIDSRVVVVDEVSMLDITIFSNLLSALRKETKLILLGDRNQLPSVDAGAVLGDITAPFMNGPEGPSGSFGTVPSLSREMHTRLSQMINDTVDPALICKDTEKNVMTDRLVVLTKSHRSQQDIIRVAHQINTQERAKPGNANGYTHQVTVDLFEKNENRMWSGAGNTETHGVLRAETEDRGNVEDEWIATFFGAAYVHAVNQAGEAMNNRIGASAHSGNGAKLKALAAEPGVREELSRMFAFLDASAMLCVVRKGDCGSEKANQRADKLLRPMLEPDGTQPFFHGSVALVTANMKQLNLYNGDRGIVLRVCGRHYFVIQRPDCHDFFPIEELLGLTQSFGMTVHKSQGCEFNSVLLVLPREKDHPLLTKEIIYTALTRAKTRAVFLGAADVCDAAIGRKVERRSGVIVRGA